MMEEKKIPQSRLSEKSTAFFNFFYFVRSRTSSGAVDGAVESAMTGKLRTKKEKVMVTKVDG